MEGHGHGSARLLVDVLGQLVGLCLHSGDGQHARMIEVPMGLGQQSCKDVQPNRLGRPGGGCHDIPPRSLLSPVVLDLGIEDGSKLCPNGFKGWTGDIAKGLPASP